MGEKEDIDGQLQPGPSGDRSGFSDGFKRGFDEAVHGRRELSEFEERHKEYVRAHAYVVEGVLESPAIQSWNEGDREKIRSYAKTIIDRWWLLDEREDRRSFRLLMGGYVVGGLAIFVVQWKVDEKLFDSGFSSRSITVPLLAIVLTFIVAGVTVASVPDGDSTGSWTDRAAAIVRWLLFSLTVCACGLLLALKAPGGIVGALLTIFAIPVMLIFGLVAAAIVDDVYGNHVRSARLDPRDHLFASLIGHLAVAQGVGRESASVDRVEGDAAWRIRQTWIPEGAWDWRRNHASRSRYGGMFEDSARAVEDHFHRIAPRSQGAARSESRIIGQRIAATLRAYGVALQTQTATFEATASSGLANGIRSALNGEWKDLAVVDPPAVATRLLRRHGRKWLAASLLIAAAFLLPEILGKPFDQAIPQFRTIVASAGILLLLDTQSSAVKRGLDLLKPR